MLTELKLPVRHGDAEYGSISSLECANNKLAKLDLNRTHIGTLSCGNNNLTVIDVSAVYDLFCEGNYISELDLSRNEELKMLDCSDNPLRTLDVSKNVKLNYLGCSGIGLTELDITSNTNISRLYCRSNDLTALNLSRNASLDVIDCGGNNIVSLDVSGNALLTILSCDNNDLKILDLRNNTKLVSVDCFSNNLVWLNIDNCGELRYLDCRNNAIAKLNTSGCPKLSDFRHDTITEIVDYHVDIRTLNPQIATVPMSNLVLGQSYTFQLEASGVTPITWLCSDGLPEGWGFSDTGLISGTPTSAGSFTFTVTASNDYGIDAKEFTLNVVELLPPKISTESIKSAITGQTYSLQLEASGATPIKWTVENLPAGLTLSESGLISGTPTKAGSSTFTVTATNSEGTDSRTFTLQIFTPVSITTSSLKTGTIGKSYSVTLRAKGTKPLTWSATGLPNGLKISEKGKISGKPTVFGTFNVKFTVSNGAGSTTKELPLTIKGIPPKLSGSLAKAELSVPYSSGLNLTKGSTPITWSIEGALPQGLTFDTEKGIISGTPMSYKSSGYKLKITASNGAGEASKSVKLTVKGTKPRITTTLSPATQGQPYSAKLTATGSEPTTWKAEKLPEGLSLNGDTISGTTTAEAKSYKVSLTAQNPVKSVKKTVTLKIVEASDTRLPVMSKSSSNSYSFADYALPELTLANSDGDIVVAVLPEISVDVSRMYEFDVALSDDVPEGAELVYLANSDSPSDDDEIVEFYDDEGEPITAVPESRLITISVWLNKNTVYNPAIAIKQ